MVRKVFLIIGVVIIALLSLPFLFISKVKKDTRYSLKCLHVLCYWINLVAGNKISIINKQILDNNQRYMLVANHRSFFDIVSIMGFINDPIVFVAKKSLSIIPIASGWFKSQNTIFVDRKDTKSGITTMKEVISNMKEGNNIGLFPAGTRSTKELSFQSALIKVAQKQGYTIIPVTIKNTELLFEERKGFKNINTEFIIHDPITKEDYQDIDSEDLTKQLENIVYQH